MSNALERRETGAAFCGAINTRKVSYRKWYSSDKCLECRQYAQAGNDSRSTSDSSSIFFISGIHLT